MLIFLGEAIRSCLAQTFPIFEVMVVNDASPDNTNEVCEAFDDVVSNIWYIKRIKGYPQPEIRGSERQLENISPYWTAMISFIPKKLEIHLDFLEKHPEIGVTYNPRYELNHSSKTIRDYGVPPLSVGSGGFSAWISLQSK